MVPLPISRMVCIRVQVFCITLVDYLEQNKLAKPSYQRRFYRLEDATQLILGTRSVTVGASSNKLS